MDMLKPCPLCMTIRAKFVRWLGVRLGVMRAVDEPKPKQEQRMEFTNDQIAAIIGTKEIELIGMRMQMQVMQARINELEAKYEPKKPELKAVDG
jgi:hypothetical protein